MTVRVFLRGGLGNQLFQYAAGMFLSRKQNEDLELRHDLLPNAWDSIMDIPRCPVQLDSFRFEGTLCCNKSQPAGKTHFFSKVLQLQRVLADIAPKLFLRMGVLAGETSNSPDFLTLQSVRTLNAYCTSLIPALMLGESLRKQIRDVVNPSPMFLDLSRQASASSPIIVHIRLGDYLKLSHLFGATDYDAISKEIDRVKNSNFAPVWLFTDSPSDLTHGIEQSLGVSRIVGPDTIESPVENLVLMASGSHFIAANSTFSWWAAFLKGEGGHVSFPKTLGSGHNIFSKDMTLKGWRSYGGE
jgi:hypothetical protein